MTHIYNAEHGFKDEYLAGLTAAYARYLRLVPDASGVMSVSAPAPGRVSVVIGGGSGHYPAFAGLVGPGLCDGAIVGNIFSSPSSEQAYRCIKALDGGAGVILAFGNYSGDVMNFGLAAQRARQDGTDVRLVLVTDDIASAGADRVADRRGIAGGFFVYRAAAAAAHGGSAIDDVERIARGVNARTFTFGVAFGGCTFPGRDEPLFTVEPGRIELGLGIHGEPGTATIDWLPADALADRILAPLLDERPAESARVQVLLNGLGSTKYEELFVLYRQIARRLDHEGIEVVTPEVGEYVTSLDMAGCSLTLCWLDDEVEALLASPATAPGYRAAGELPQAGRVVAAAQPGALASGSRETRPPAGSARASRRRPVTGTARSAAIAFGAMARAIAAIEGELGRLDAVAGDGDHGAGMVRGLSAAAIAAATAGPSLSDVINAAGLAFSDAAGGASGALWGAGLLAAAGALRGTDGNGQDPAQSAVSSAAVQRAVRAALEAVVQLGRATRGDKTLVDALEPFVEAFDAADAVPVAEAWRTAAAVARRAAADTADLAATRGRAALHGARSRGFPDPGAVSLATALVAAGDSFGDACGAPLPA